MSERVSTKKTVQGKVVSSVMDKTAVIELVFMHTHPIFKKITRKTKKVKIHDERNECNIGDLVIAVETRPLSKFKIHRLLKIVERAK